MGEGQLTTQALPPTTAVSIIAAAPPSVASAETVTPPAPSGVPASPEARSTEFRAVEGGSEMQSGTALLTEAYAAIWLCAFALLFAGVRRMKKLDQRIDALAEEVARSRKKE